MVTPSYAYLPEVLVKKLHALRGQALTIGYSRVCKIEEVEKDDIEEYLSAIGDMILSLHLSERRDFSTEYSEGMNQGKGTPIDQIDCKKVYSDLVIMKKDLGVK
jgi:hypothetical protein